MGAGTRLFKSVIHSLTTPDLEGVKELVDAELAARKQSGTDDRRGGGVWYGPFFSGVLCSEHFGKFTKFNLNSAHNDF